MGTAGGGPAAGPEARGAREAAIPPVVVAAVAIAVNAVTLANGFVFDDLHFIVGNPWVTSPGHLWQIFTSHAAGFDPAYASSYYRPAQHLLYRLIDLAFGLSPAAFHAVNVLMHAAVCALVALIAARTAEEAGADERTRAWFAWVPGLLFALHPVHVESVAWMAGITDVSYALFALLSLWVYLSGGAEPRLARRLVSALLFFAALLCKEPAVVVLPLMVAHEWIVRGARPWPALRATAVRAWPHLVALAVYLALRAGALGALAPAQQHAALGAVMQAANAFPLLAWHVLTIVWPVGLAPLHVFEPAVSLGDPRVLAGLGIAAALAVLWWRAGGRPLVRMGVLWFALPLLPALYYPVLSDYVVAERYDYLSIAGVGMLCAAACAGLARAWPRRARAVAFAAGAVLAVLGTMTVLQDRVWRDATTLWTATVERSPQSAEAHEFLGNALYESGRYEEAIAQFARALELAPNRVSPDVNLCAALAATGRFEEAVRRCRAAVAGGIDDAHVYGNLGYAYLRSGRFGDAVVALREALRRDPSLADAHFNLGVALLQSEGPAAALGEFETAARLAPGNRSFADTAARVRALAR